MSKPTKPKYGEDSETAKRALKTEKEQKSNLQTRQSGLPADTPPEIQPEIQPEIRLKTEIGGQTGPEPTRYGDWEKNGRCTDF